MLWRNSKERAELLEQANKHGTALEKARPQDTRELVDSLRGLIVRIDLEKSSPRARTAFYKELMHNVGRTTRTIDASGKMSHGFCAVMTKDGSSISFLCFHEGLEELEIALATTQAKLLALKHGVSIMGIEEFGQGEQAAGQQRRGLAEKKETVSGGRCVTGIVTIQAGSEFEVKVTVRHDVLNKKVPPKAILGVGKMMLIYAIDRATLEALTTDPAMLPEICDIEKYLMMVARDPILLEMMIGNNPTLLEQCKEDQEIALRTVRQIIDRWLANEASMQSAVDNIPKGAQLTREMMASVIESSATDPFLEVTDERELDQTPEDQLSIQAAHYNRNLQ